MLKLKIDDVQDGDNRFNLDSPDRMFPKKYCKEITRGQSAMPWGCPFWVDATLEDEKGVVTPERVEELHLEMTPVWHLYVNGELNEVQGPNHDGSVYKWSRGFKTRFHRMDDNTEVKVVCEIAGEKAELSFRVS